MSENTIVHNLLDLWQDMPRSTQRAIRLAAWLTFATGLSLFIAWGAFAYTLWIAWLGDWSAESRGASLLLWFFFQCPATGIALLLGGRE